MCCRNTTEFMIFGLVVMCLMSPYHIMARTLEDELRDFCDIMPNDKIKEIAETHIRTDREFNEAITFLQSNTWVNMIRDIQQNIEWKRLKKHLNQSGLNIDHIYKSLFNFVTDLKPIRNQKKTARSLRAFFNDVELILPIGKLLAMLHEKKQNSTTFRAFYDKLSSHDVHRMFENVRKQPEMRRILVELRSMGARVDDIFELFYGFMNWDSPTPVVKRESPDQKTGITENLEDFKRLIPWNVLQNISEKYTDDKQFSSVILYLQGKEFEKIVDAVKIRPEYQELKNYLASAGMDVESIIKLFADLILNAKPGPVDEMEKMKIKNTSFRTYLDEIEANIPADQLLILFNDKMEHNEDFKNFIKKISDPKVKKMSDNILALPESKVLFDKLQKLGVKIRETLIIIYACLGWGSPFEEPSKPHA